MPILEMMATACCGADNSGEARSTLSSKWTQLKFHKGTRLWAEEAWKMHQPPAVGERAPSPVPQVVQSPEMKVRDLFGNRPRRPGVTIARAATAPVNPPPTARRSMPEMDMGDMMVKVIEVQTKASLALHESYRADLRENIRLTGTAVVATGASKDALLTESKLRILRACTGEDD